MTASDGNGGAATATVTININDVNEPPRAVAKPAASPVTGTHDRIAVRRTPPDNTGRPDITGYDVLANSSIRAANVVGDSTNAGWTPERVL